MAVPARIDWPIPDSAILGGIVRSISARSKAFKKQVWRFDIGLETDSKTGAEYERLNLTLKSWNPRPDRLTFTFWDDGVLRVDARQSARSGWNYELSFYGNFNNVAPDLVRDMIEQSLWVTDREKMEAIWDRCEPYTE